MKMYGIVLLNALTGGIHKQLIATHLASMTVLMDSRSLLTILLVKWMFPIVIQDLTQVMTSAIGFVMAAPQDISGVRMMKSGTVGLVK